MLKTNKERTLVGLRVTIYPRGKRRIYVADFHYNGRHCRRSLGTTNKKAAMQKAIELEHDLANGHLETERGVTSSRALGTNISIKVACCDYIDFLTTEGRRRKTVVKYEGILKKFEGFAADLGAADLSRIDLILIDRYRAQQQPLLSMKSMHHEGSLLKRFSAWCVERQLMASNPLANRTFRAPKAEPRGGPTLKQINAILKASTPMRRPIIAVAAFAGLRIGEITKLRVEDVDFKDNWIHIVSRPGFETKSGDTWKTPIHPRLQEILENLPKTKAGWFFTAQPSRKYPQGSHHINPKHVNEDFIKTLNQLGIPSGRDSGFTFHSLRGSFKTVCINSGIPKQAVDVWQNHAPDRAASHVYYRLTDEESQRLIRLAKFDDE